MWPQVVLDMLIRAAPTSPLLGLQMWTTVLHGVISNRWAQEIKVREKAQLQTREVISKLPKQELEDHTYHFRTNSVSIQALRSGPCLIPQALAKYMSERCHLKTDMPIRGLKLAWCCTESFKFLCIWLVGSLEKSPQGNLPVLIPWNTVFPLGLPCSPSS